MNERSEPAQRAPVFRRELPGGGYVVVGVERPSTDRTVPRTCVWLERRAGDVAGEAATLAAAKRHLGTRRHFRLVRGALDGA